MLSCPSCGSDHVAKNGRIHHGKQTHRCRACGRRFVQNPTQKRISQETKELIHKLLLERLPLAGIARVTDVSETWLQHHVNRLYQAQEQQAQGASKKGA